MKGKNKKRRIAKKITVDHPLYLFLFSMIVIIFGGTALFINLNRVYCFSPFVNFAAGAGITLLGVVSSILFFTNLSKIQKAEIRGKLKKLNFKFTLKSEWLPKNLREAFLIQFL